MSVGIRSNILRDMMGNMRISILDQLSIITWRHEAILPDITETEREQRQKIIKKMNRKKRKIKKQYKNKIKKKFIKRGNLRKQ